MLRFSWLLLCLLPSSVFARVTVEARVDKARVAAMEPVTLTVDVSGSEATLPEPSIGSLPHWRVYSRGRSHNLEIVSGKIYASVEYIYTLLPERSGRFEIGPVTVEDHGRRVSSRPITVLVTSGSGPPAPSADRPPERDRGGERRREGVSPDAPSAGEVFVTAETDKTHPYVNEETILTVRFFTAVNLLGNAQYSPPSLAGFLSEDLPPERHGTVNLHGRTYYYSEIKTALFPLSAGRLTVGPARVQCQVERSMAWDPFAPDFFNHFFSQSMGGYEPRTLASSPLTIMAEALPAQGKPPDFSGAVGRFNVTASLDKKRARVGDAVTLTVAVQGTGNIKSLGAPPLPAPLAEFRKYDTVSSLALSKAEGRVSGSKIFKTVLVPRVRGNLAIPPIRFSYFDPEKKAYVTAKSAPLFLNVSPPPPGAQSVAGPLSFGAAQPAELTALSQDIRYLKTARLRGPLSRMSSGLAAAKGFNAAPFIFFAGCLLFSRVRQARDKNPALRKRRRALKTAHDRIKKAKETPDPAQAEALLAEALRGYLADKLREPSPGLTAGRAVDLLKERYPSLNGETARKLKDFWDDFDRQRFAPGHLSALEEGTTSALIELIENLEKELE